MFTSQVRTLSFLLLSLSLSSIPDVHSTRAQSQQVRTSSSNLRFYRNFIITAAAYADKKKKNNVVKAEFQSNMKQRCCQRHPTWWLGCRKKTYIRNAKYTLMHWAAWQKHERVCPRAVFLGFQSYCISPEKLCLLEKAIFLNCFLFLGCCKRCNEPVYIKDIFLKQKKKKWFEGMKGCQLWDEEVLPCEWGSAIVDYLFLLTLSIEISSKQSREEWEEREEKLLSGSRSQLWKYLLLFPDLLITSSEYKAFFFFFCMTNLQI